MFIKISTGKEIKPVEISKKQTVKELKYLIEETLNINVSNQRLFFSGKLLDDSTPIYKYDVKDGYIIQVIEFINNNSPVKAKPVKEKEINKELTNLSEYYKLGDWIELQEEDGSWIEAEIVEVSQQTDEESHGNSPLNIIYKMYYKKDNQVFTKYVKLNEFRPRSVRPFDMNKLAVDKKFHVNYNIENPKAWGKWYDFLIDEFDKLTLTGKILLAGDKVIENIKLDLDIVKGSVFSIRNHVKFNERDKNFVLGAKPIFCNKCKKDRIMKCRDCACSVCGGREAPDKTIICDECHSEFHISCLQPPLEAIPEEDDWYCKNCKNQHDIVKVGETVKTKRGSTADKTKSSR